MFFRSWRLGLLSLHVPGAMPDTDGAWRGVASLPRSHPASQQPKLGFEPEHLRPYAVPSPPEASQKEALEQCQKL